MSRAIQRHQKYALRQLKKQERRILEDRIKTNYRKGVNFTSSKDDQIVQLSDVISQAVMLGRYYVAFNQITLCFDHYLGANFNKMQDAKSAALRYEEECGDDRHCDDLWETAWTYQKRFNDMVAGDPWLGVICNALDSAVELSQHGSNAPNPNPMWQTHLLELHRLGQPEWKRKAMIDDYWNVIGAVQSTALLFDHIEKQVYHRG